ncbi:MAG: TIGR00730 family Rossman fold protein [Thermoanaerobaculia bacterium]
MHAPFDRPLVAVFCGSHSGLSPHHAEDAASVGRAIARLGAGLVFGGGRVGLMGALADAALEEGAPVWGVIPAGLEKRELAHPGCTRLDVVATMHERKRRIAEVATGFIALAGGFGTLDEFFEIVTWRQLGHHSRPIVLFNGAGFWDPLLSAVDRLTEEQFVRDAEEHFVVETTPEGAVRRALSEWDGGA